MSAATFLSITSIDCPAVFRRDRQFQISCRISGASPSVVLIATGSEVHVALAAAKILAAELRPEDSATIGGFLTTLSAAEEATVATMLAEKLPENPQLVTNHAWRELDWRRVKRRLAACEARLRQGGLDEEEQLHLQIEIRDLKAHAVQLAAWKI